MGLLDCSKPLHTKYIDMNRETDEGMQLVTPIQIAVFTGFLAVLVIAMGIMVAPFWGMLFLALLFAYVLSPVYDWLQNKYGSRPKRHTAYVFIGFALAVVIPASIALLSITASIQNIGSSIVALFNNDATQALIKDLESLLSNANVTEQSKALVDGKLQEMAARLTESLIKLGGTILTLLVNLAMFSIFFVVILPNLKKMNQYVLEILPFREKLTKLYLRRAGRITHDMVVGSFVVAFLTAVVLWFTLAFLGVPDPTMLAFIAFLLGFIPFLGPSLITIPLGIIYILQGDYISMLIIWGVHLLVINNIDLLVRPYVVSEEAKMHPMLLIIAILGGLNAWGILGLFYGPVIMILLKTSLEALVENYRAGRLALKDEYFEETIRERIDEIADQKTIPLNKSEKSSKKKASKKKKAKK